MKTHSLAGVELVDTATGEVKSINCDGAFIAIGHRPNIAFLGGQISLDDKGYVQCGPNSTMTSVPGVFACGRWFYSLVGSGNNNSSHVIGDVADSRYKQAITAAGSGCQAAIDAEKWLEEQHTSYE
jgi:thioredoxin reductase (NADPH)